MFAKPPLSKRFGALLIDYGVTLPWIAIIVLVNYVLFFVLLDGIPDYLGTIGVLATQLLFASILVVPVGLYLFFAESSSQQATLGKKKLGLKVSSIDGKPASRKQIAIRTIIKLLPWEIAHTFIWQLQAFFYVNGHEAMPPAWIFIDLNLASVLALIYILMVLVRKDGRSVHDLAAKQ